MIATSKSVLGFFILFLNRLLNFLAFSCVPGLKGMYLNISGFLVYSYTVSMSACVVSRSMSLLVIIRLNRDTVNCR